MRTSLDQALQHEIEIAASPARVWAAVSDVRRMHEWSPQVVSTRLRSGYDEVTLGAQLTNLNHLGEVEWITHAEIVRFEPEQAIAFRIAENTVIWSFVLEPAGDASRLVHRRDAPDGISDQARAYVDGHLGGLDAFGRAMVDGMRQTLARLKASLEA